MSVIAVDGYLVRATLLATVIAAGLLGGALVLQQPVAIPGAVVMLAAPYVALVAFETESLDARAPLVAALLFAIAELAYWSLELRGTLADEAGTYLRRLSVLAVLALATVIGGTAVLALAAAVGARGTGVDVVGAAAALLAVALLALAAASRRDVR